MLLNSVTPCTYNRRLLTHNHRCLAPADEAVVAARGVLSSLKPAPDTAAFEAGKEVMEKLRNMHMVLGSTMESMLQEMASRFVPRPLERLLAVVTALLHRWASTA
jgi:hypothetical protein